MMTTEEAMNLVRDELRRATEAFHEFASPHEGWAIIEEEMDEFWDEIKAGRGQSVRGCEEAVQVAAMAVRFLVDLVDLETAQDYERLKA